MTVPSVTRDLLMFAPSLSRWPVAPVEFALSLKKQNKTNMDRKLKYTKNKWRNIETCSDDCNPS